MDNFKQITVDQAQQLIDQKDPNIVDIRDPQSFEVKHIPKAIQISQDNLENFIKTADKNKPLLCYCYHGFSSQSTAQFFIKQGFKDVYSMEGGFEAWKAARHEPKN